MREAAGERQSGVKGLQRPRLNQEIGKTPAIDKKLVRAMLDAAEGAFAEAKTESARGRGHMTMQCYTCSSLWVVGSPSCAIYRSKTIDSGWVAMGEQVKAFECTFADM